MNNIFCTEKLCFLDKINYPAINIEQLKFTFITGKSGCGKSTFLKILNRTVIPSDGSVRYNKKNISEYNPVEYRKEVMLVPQNCYLFDGTIKDNFSEYYTARDTEIPTDDEINTALRVCCIDFSLDTKCNTLSGGEKQRVFLAVFLSTKPKVLLLDEPTSALDEKTSVQLLTNIRQYCNDNGITPVAVCHSKELVSTFADTVIEL